MTAAPTITASATATIVPSGDYCVVSLVNTATTGISVGGTTDVDLGCGMITNSTSMDAAVAFGTSEVDASPIAAVGGIDANDNWTDDTVLLPFTMAQADPFANVYPPTPGGCQKFSDFDPGNNNKPGGVVDLSSSDRHHLHQGNRRNARIPGHQGGRQTWRGDLRFGCDQPENDGHRREAELHMAVRSS